jgi:hypothetical protein
MRTLIWTCVLGLLAISTAWAGAEVITGSWSTENGQVKTNYWKETFVGGRAGAVGNTLLAVGTGFKFSDAAIAAPGPSCAPDPVKGALLCTTPYTGGQLFLNAGGPWLKSGNVTLTNIAATNTSWSYAGGALEFSITFTAAFSVGTDNYSIAVTASWGPGIPETRVEKKLVIQRGTDFDCVVTITKQ